VILESENKPDHLRLHLLFGFMLLFFGAIAIRLWYLQVVKNEEFLLLAEKQRTRQIRRKAPRGEIMDAKGRVLVTNRPYFVVSALPDEVKKHPEVLPRLIQLLGLNPEDIEEQMKASKRTPSDPIPLVEVEPEDPYTLSKVEENLVNLPGIFIATEPKRLYQDNQTCTHVLGIVRPISKARLEKMVDQGYRPGDYVGVEGIEASYEPELRGGDGGQFVEVDVKGRVRKTLDERNPTPGHTLQLTLDLDLQKVAHEALQEQLAKGRTGAIVALDPQDGAVLAMASSPSYDLNRFDSDYSTWLANPLHPLYNRATMMAQASGSPFKLITAAAGLESGTLSTGSGDTCPGYIMVGKQRFNCDKRSGHGHLNFYNAIAASCDVYFYHTAMNAGIDNLSKWAKNFGLGSKTQIDLPEDFESAGTVPNPEWKQKRFRRSRTRNPWVKGDLVNLGIGQGYLRVTPLQLAVFTSALANGGEVLKPQLVREIRDISEEKSVVIHRLTKQVRQKTGLRPEYRNAIVEGMRRVVQEHGTGSNVAIAGITVAGKTGTVERLEKGVYVDDSVFVCFAPLENPKIAIAVVVQKGNWGSETAAPIARRLLMQYFGQQKPAPRQTPTTSTNRTTRNASNQRPRPRQSVTPKENPPAPTPTDENLPPAEEPSRHEETPTPQPQTEPPTTEGGEP
jgi:penicillin-binding protein 2